MYIIIFFIIVLNIDLYEFFIVYKRFYFYDKKNAKMAKKN